VYHIPGPAARGPSLSITKDYITLLGLANNRRTVVLADNRGLQQGAEDDGFIIDVKATGFTAKNLTIINYCNADYEYPGDPGSWLVEDEYLFGSDILVAPLMESGVSARDVYLPPGQWIDYQSGKVYAGGWHNIAAIAPEVV